jgi:hypothetical protein
MDLCALWRAVPNPTVGRQLIHAGNLWNVAARRDRERGYLLVHAGVKPFPAVGFVVVRFRAKGRIEPKQGHCRGLARWKLLAVLGCSLGSCTDGSP